MEYFFYTLIVEGEGFEFECLYWKLRCQPVKLNFIEILEKTDNELHRTLCEKSASLQQNMS